MRKLEVKENKRLVLKNVVCCELRSIELALIDQEIQKVIQQFKLLKMQVFGPLVTKNIGTRVNETGQVVADYDIIVQAHDYQQYRSNYKTLDQLICDFCVYVRFEGHPEYLNYAYTKLDLYLYEHEYESDGTIVSVLVHDRPEHITMDIFRPVQFL